jgi:hypothetical protein
MSWTVQFSAKGLKAFNKLDKSAQNRIKEYLIARTAQNPTQ